MDVDGQRSRNCEKGPGHHMLIRILRVGYGANERNRAPSSTHGGMDKRQLAPGCLTATPQFAKPDAVVDLLASTHPSPAEAAVWSPTHRR